MSTPRLQTLAAVEAAVWSQLEQAVRDKNDPWRLAVLATRAAPFAPDDGAEDGEAKPGADARCVLLREVDRPEHKLLFFADARSAKVQQMALDPLGTLVLWSAALGWQLRLGVRLEVAHSGLAVSSRWARLKMTPAAQDYLSPLPPGSTLEGPDSHRAPPPMPERSSREYFSVVTARVTRLDWLELHAEGHRRAIFDAAGPRWVVP
jgi:hypothetical protein